MLEIVHDHPFGDNAEILRLSLTGRLDASGADTFNDAVKVFCQQAHTVILDMSSLDYLSSAGIRSLLQAHKALASRSASLLLMGLRPFVRQVVELSGMARMFSVVEDVDDARLRCAQDAIAPWQKELEFEGGTASLSFTPWCDAFSAVETWETNAEQPKSQVSLAELGLCMGYGGFGTRREQAEENMGLFLSGMHVAALLQEKQHKPDFITTRYPLETVMYVANAAAVNGEPCCCMRLKSEAKVPLATALQALDAGLRSAGLHQAAGQEARGLRAAFLQLADLTIGGKEAPGAVGLCFYMAEGSRADLPPCLADLPWQEHDGLELCCVALSVDKRPSGGCDALPLEALEQTCDLQSIISFGPLGPDSAFSEAALWAFAPSVLRSSSEKRLTIDYALAPQSSAETENYGSLGLHRQGAAAAGDAVAASAPATLDAWDALIRSIYVSAEPPSAGRVVLQPLRGGYSSTNFLVESFDVQGKRLLPTALKLGDAAVLQREEQAWKQHVQPFIANNATSLTGSVQHGEHAGLRYNFMDMDGPNASLTSLAQFYAENTVADILPVFDRLVTRVLKPWYSQPSWDVQHLWQEHDPTRLFPTIIESAQRELGLFPDAEFFDSPELGRQLRNPFHVLAHEFPRLASETTNWYSSIVHGDLNMQNVLLDEARNIYVVDFSETQRGNAVADFARLEPILLLEHTRLNSEADADALARFLETWYAGHTYAAVPPFGYSGSDPHVSKAYQIMRRLRRYADTVTLFETDIRPYLLAVLQWTLPTVCFKDFEPERKRVGAIMAAILCEQLLGEG